MSENKESNIIKARFNEEEMLKFNELKEFLGFKGQFGEDSRTLKAAVFCALNVAHCFLGENLPQLFSSVKSFKEKILEK